MEWWGRGYVQSLVLLLLLHDEKIIIAAHSFM
jgi:hypothetical protein